MPHGSVRRGRLSSSKKKQSRKRRLSSRISKGSFDKKPIKPGLSDCSSFANFPIKDANNENSFFHTKNI
ncbi:uncharacterized protein G2W53_010213 [Senna tora]|uniref:Uncharacterized protein n=1 Tax=Senna tora TaxID=362788 RepID=A0A834WZT6_9FABA|nr:uncharacterized protein G2W53_010213 [Senna tora]